MTEPATVPASQLLEGQRILLAGRAARVTEVTEVPPATHQPEGAPEPLPVPGVPTLIRIRTEGMEHGQEILVAPSTPMKVVD